MRNATSSVSMAIYTLICAFGLLVTTNAQPGDLDPTFGNGGKVFTTVGKPAVYGNATAVQPDGKIIIGGWQKDGSGTHFGLARLNPNGSLDSAFGNNGKVLTNLGGSFERVYAIAIQTDGKIVAVGESDFRFALARYNPDGSLDAAFHGDGRVTTDNYPSYLYAAAIQADGKIVVAGNNIGHLAVARFAGDGSLDTTFSDDGIVTTEFESTSTAHGLAIQIDGKIVAAGTQNTGPNRIVLARYHSDGSPDTSFDGDGKVITAFDSPDHVGAQAIALQANQKIVVAGTRSPGSGTGTGEFAVARYNTDGSLDASFDGDGRLTISFDPQYGDSASALGIQADGKIVVAGSGFNANFALARLNNNGTLDTSFDGDGKVVTIYSDFTGAGDMALQGDGKIVAVGVGSAGSLRRTHIIRYNSNGSLDTTFGVGGKIQIIADLVTDDFAAAVAIQPDGKIIIGGTSLVRYNANGTLDDTFGDYGILRTEYRFMTSRAIAIQGDGKIVVAGNIYIDFTDPVFSLARYKSDGSPDTSFGTNGRITSTFSTGSLANGIAIQADGKIVAAGWALTPSLTSYDVVLARYNSNGSLDTTFDGDGRVFTDISGGGDDFATDVAIQTDGKIVAAGATYSTNDWVLTRYNSNGSLDLGFGGNGKVITDIGNNTNDIAQAVAIQADGRIVAAGVGNNGFSLARYQSNGLLDTDFDLDGKVTTTGFDQDLYGGAEPYGLAMQADGKIIAVGGSDQGYDKFIGYFYRRFTVARYNTNGSLDLGFSGDGKVADLLSGGNESAAVAVAIQADGKIVTAGYGRSSATGLLEILVARYSVEPTAALFDYDGDGRTDVSVFRPSTNEWHIMQSGGGIRVQGWGLAGDKMAPADFDGDGKTDIAVFRPTEGNWYVINSSNNTVTIAGWGLATDKLVPGDYNGDGKADFVVFRESEGRWYRRDTDGQVHFQDWGLPEDKPAPADFDGDGRLDLTVFRPSEGRWYTIRSSDAAITATDWGVSGDIPVAADYSGDGKADFVVFRPSDLTWYRRHSDDSTLHFITWGLAGDIPAPGDFDGDGKQDLAVYRPSNGTWYIFGSQSGIYSQPFGLAGDLPTPNAFVY